MNYSLFSFWSGRSRAVVWKLALCAACAALLAGCGTSPKLDVPDASQAVGPSDEDMLESYRLALQDEGLPLSDVEMRALLSTGEVDKGLSTDDMREVQVYFKHYIHSARPVVERFMRRGQSYIGYTRRIFRERGLPEELAYLAFVESGYNPVAVSRSNAVGMWQFMAGTGRQYGLRQDWWMDDRRDPYRATRAAADYLSKLYGDFGDWHLAVAAYNAGEGKIGRALQGTRAETFFALCRNNGLLDDKARLKEETRQYVPRFLAVCKIMRNAEALGFSPAEEVDTERALLPVAELSARPGTDLAALAGRLNMSWEEFAAYNPAFRRYITPPDRYAPVYVPSALQAQAALLLRDVSLSGSGWTTYTVAKGDSIDRISKRTGVPVSVLRQLNRKSEPLKAGAKLRIPGRAGTVQASVDKNSKAVRPVAPAKAPAGSRAVAAASSKNSAGAVSGKTATGSAQSAHKAATGKAATHTVRRGETLASLARRYGVSMAAISAVNPQLTNPQSLRVGQVLKLPDSSAPAKSSAQASNTTAATAKSGTAAKSGKAATGKAATHTVRRGETLASLARHYGVSMAAISAANPQLTNPHSLRVGQVLTVPSAGTAARAASARTPATYKVQPGDTMWGIARKFNIPPAELLALNQLKDAGDLHPGDFVRVTPH